MDTTLDDYLAYLKLRDDDNQPYVLIGGQAANFWANHYLPRLPELNALYPFTSRDIDFFGTRDDVKRISNQMGLKPHYSTIDAPDPIAGFLLPKLRGEEVRVEYLHWVMNLSEEELRNGSAPQTWRDNEIRVVLPPYLLQSKLGCLGHLPQGERQDEKHCRILLPCVRCFLEDTLEKVAAGELTERAYIKMLKHVMDLSISRAAKDAARKALLPWKQAMPAMELLAMHPKIESFILKTAAARYPHMFGSSPSEFQTETGGPNLPLPRAELSGGGDQGKGRV